jgi:hypothetical protein
MALDDALAPVHNCAPDVDELGIFRKQISNAVGVHGVQRDGERVDDLMGFRESRHLSLLRFE